MNKYEKALDWLTWHCIAKNEYHDDEIVYERIKNFFIEPVIKPLRDLIEKATPKKPILGHADKDLSYYEWNCPTCDEFHMSHVIEKYCSHCGQAIDWSEDDNCQN